MNEVMKEHSALSKLVVRMLCAIWAYDIAVRMMLVFIVAFVKDGDNLFKKEEHGMDINAMVTGQRLVGDAAANRYYNNTKALSWVLVILSMAALTYLVILSPFLLAAPIMVSPWLIKYGNMLFEYSFAECSLLNIGRVMEPKEYGVPKCENLEEFMKHQKMMKMLRKLDADDQIKEDVKWEILEADRVRNRDAVYAIVNMIPRVSPVVITCLGYIYYGAFPVIVGWALVLSLWIIWCISSNMVDRARAQAQLYATLSPDEKLEHQMIKTNELLKGLTALSVIHSWDRKR